MEVGTKAVAEVVKLTGSRTELAQGSEASRKYWSICTFKDFFLVRLSIGMASEIKSENTYFLSIQN